jgi:hypothetical protein
MKKKIITITIILFVISITTFIFSSYKKNSEKIPRIKATLYQSPSCECCVIYGKYLEQYGFSVETVFVENLSTIKEKYKIPQKMESCHTVEIENYFVEGHVPIEAIKKLLNERPEINGISLPGMPSGSPGMPGFKRGKFRIYQITFKGQNGGIFMEL